MMDLLQQAESAIGTFYHCENHNDRNVAHQWLLELQKSSEGWKISWMLLDSQKCVEVQYYGAIILHYKITHDVKDIPVEQRNELKSNFHQLLLTHSNGPKLIISKICSVIVAYIIQISSDDFTLFGFVSEIENTFKARNLNSQAVVLELLTVIPTEFKMLNLDSNQKIRARKFMNDFIKMVLMMCSQVLQLNNTSQSDINYQIDTLNCFLNWIEFGISIIDAEDLLPLLFSKVSVEEISDKICEVLTELVTVPTSYTAEKTVLSFLQQILQFEELINQCIESGNEEFVKNLCLLFSNLGETHCRTFLKTTDSTYQLAMLNFVKIMLKFTSLKGFYPVDETCSELTFNFWYTLQDDLYSIDVENVTDYQKQFYDAYVMLIDVFHIKCQYPPDNVYEKYNADEKEMFRCYRIDIQDTMLYVCTLLGERCLMYFCKKLEQILLDSSTQWQQHEGFLHLLRGAVESIDTEESTYLPKIISVLSQIQQHPKVLNSMFLFFGGLSEWLNSHPDQIIHVLPFLLQGIFNEDTSTSCSIALKDLCHECALLLNHEFMLQILETCQKGLLAQNTSLKTIVRFFEIGGYVISALPVDRMNLRIDILVSPLFQWLTVLLKQGTVTILSKKTVVHYLNCFYGLFRALDPFEELPVHPIVLIFVQLVPLLHLLKPWCKFEEVAVSAANCITKALEIAREKLTDHASVICEVLAEFFLTQPYGCILDTSSVLIGMLGTEPDSTEQTKSLYKLLTTTCVKMIEHGDSKNYPDCMQSFMDLLTRTAKTVPEFLYENMEHQITLLKCGLILLTYQETPTIKSTCNFFMTYINFANTYDSGKKVVESIGRDIVFQTMLCISGVAPRHTTDHFADVILSLNKHNITCLAIWLNELFATEGFPSLHATQLQKDHFRKFVLREKTNKRRLKEIVRNFSLVCRGIHGMPYTQ